jgi:methyl-accepting chemotaxis protein
MQVILLSLTFLISIFMSHKIAGPLYKLNQFFREAKAGNLDQVLFFRNRDYFQELVPEYNGMMESIRNRMKQKTTGIELAIPHIEKAIQHSSIEARFELEAALKNLKNT